MEEYKDFTLDDVVNHARAYWGNCGADHKIPAADSSFTSVIQQKRIRSGDDGALDKEMISNKRIKEYFGPKQEAFPV